MTRTKPYRSRILLAVALCLVLPRPGLAWDLELKRALLKVHLGTATEAETLLVIRSNDVVNRMAVTGHMPDRLYQSAQKTFADFNRAVATKAAADNGLDLKQQAASGPPKPGTDSDYIASGRTGRVSVDQVKGAIIDYNAEMNRRLGTQNVDYAKKLNTDIMGNHTQMTPEDFAAVRKLNNDAYDRVGATEYETKLHHDPADPTPPEPVTTAETADYKRQMRDLIDKKSKQIAELQAEVTEAFKADPNGLKSQTRDLEAELQIRRHQQAKYVQRYADATAATAERWGVTRPEATTLPKTAADRSIAPAANTPAADTPRPQAQIAADKAKATQTLSSVEGHVAQGVRAQGAVADAGAARAARGLPDADTLMASAAEQIAGLPPSRQGQVIDEVRARFGNEAARDLADRTSRRNARPEPAGGAKPVVEPEAGIVGKTLQIVAIAGMANEARAILKGEKSTIEIAETVTDMVSGGLYSAGSSLAEWKRIHDTAQRTFVTETEARIFQVARDLVKRGVGVDAVKTIVRDMQAGSEASLDAAVRGLAAKGVSYAKPAVPKPMTFEAFTASGYVKAVFGNAVDAVGGMMMAPLTLVRDTGRDIAEVTIFTSDFDKAMADISDADLQVAEMQSQLAAMGFVAKLVALGASEAEARAALERWMTGSTDGLVRLRALRDRLAKAGGTTVAKAPEPAPEELARRRAHVIERLAQLNHAKLQATLQAVGVTPPEELYHCLCRAAGYGASGTAQFYHPQTIGAFNPAYSCSQPGEPCVVSGFGCTRHPLPSSPAAWVGCIRDNRVGVTTMADGKPDPRSGETLDALIERSLRQR